MSFNYKNSWEDSQELKKLSPLSLNTLETWKGSSFKKFKHQRQTQSANVVVDKIFKKLNINKNYSMEKIQKIWKYCAGPYLSQYTNPEKIIDKTIVIATTHSTVLTEFENNYKFDILQKLQKVMPNSIEKIKIIIK